MKRLIGIFCGILAVSVTAQAQVLLSGGLNYSQNFDSLPSTGASGAWTDNTTLAGWYASRATTSSTVSYGPNSYTVFRVDSGANNSGSLFDYGVAGVNAITDRALGSLSSGTPGTNAFGVRFKNDTASAYNVTIGYTGEQWRNGGNTSPQTLQFTYLAGSAASLPLSAWGSATGDPSGQTWTSVSALSFTSPTVGATAAALDGNDAANRTVFAPTTLAGVTINPGDELFVRWYDINDPGSDHALAVDDFSASFSAVPEPQVLSLLGGFGFLAFLIRRRR
jgi:hypothetical protein